MNLYEQHRDFFDKLAPSIAEMARHFYKPQAMSFALGYSEGVVSRWIRGHTSVSGSAAERAKKWIDANSKPIEKQGSNNLFLVTCTPESADKVRRVLAMLGCEVVDV